MSHKECVSVLTAMSLLANKMKHGSQLVLSCLVIRSEAPPTEQDPLTPAKPRGEHVPQSPSPSPSKIYLVCLCCSEEPKTDKTAWEHYNEGTYPAIS